MAGLQKSMCEQLNFQPNLDYLQRLADTFHKIRSYTEQTMQEAKRSNLLPEEQLIKINSDSVFPFIRLRSLNREAYHDKGAVKNATQEAKQEMDQANLQLQNLKCEKQYLQREIFKCKSFNSIYQNIPIVSEEEFLARAPEEFKSSSVDVQDEQVDDDILKHNRMIQRLKFEKAERIRMEAERDEKSLRKRKLSETLTQKRNRIEEVDKAVEKFFKETATLQNIFASQNGDSNGLTSPEDHPMGQTEVAASDSQQS